MKFKNNHVGFLLAVLITILLKCALLAQVNANLEFRAETPHTSYAQVCHSNTCNQGYSSDRDEGEALTDKIKATFPVAVSSKGNVSIDADIISGIITCGDVNCAGDGSYRREIYVDAVPGIDVKVRFQSTSQTTGTGWAKFTYSGTEHTLANGTSQWSEVVKPSTYKTILVGEKTYYWLGSLVLQAGAGGGAGSNGGVSAQISNIQANYIGNVIIKAEGDNGDNQTWVEKERLPVPFRVKLVDGETGAPVVGKQISYTITYPNNVTIGMTTTNTGNDGIASAITSLWVPGIYTITAICPPTVCVPGMREVTFTATAVSKNEATELQLKTCDRFGVVAQPLQNPIKVKAFNTYTRTGEADFNVSFAVVDYVSQAYNLDPEYPKMSTTKPPYGNATASFSPGLSYGRYTVRALCENCRVNKEVFCPITAVPIKKTQKDRGLVDANLGINVQFVPASFTVVYGKAVDVCATVSPPDRKSEVSSFASVMGGFSAIINSVATPDCSGTGKISVHVRSNTDVCVPQDTLHALVNNAQPVGLVQGSIILPTSEYAVRLDEFTNSSRCEALEARPWCKFDSYDIIFSPNIDVSGEGMLRERLLNRESLPGLQLCREYPVPTGTGPIFFENGIFKANDSIGLVNQLEIPRNCGYKFEQVVFIGACPIQTNFIAVRFDANGNITTTRTDLR